MTIAIVHREGSDHEHINSTEKDQIMNISIGAEDDQIMNISIVQRRIRSRTYH